MMTLLQLSYILILKVFTWQGSLSKMKDFITHTVYMITLHIRDHITTLGTSPYTPWFLTD